MACTKDDGSLTQMAKDLVLALQNPAALHTLCPTLQVPLYRIRSSVRELQSMGFVKELDGGNQYQATPLGVETARR